MSGNRKTRVVWTDDEIAAVAAEAVQISLLEKEFIWWFVNRAQKVLPENRRRGITGKNGINAKIIDAFSRERQEVLELAMPLQVEIEKPVVEVLVDRPRKDMLESVTTEELIGLIVKRAAPLFDLVPALLQNGNERLSRGGASVHQAGVATPAPSTTASPRKQKVLLYGFLPGQETDICDKAKSFNLELQFVEKDSRMQGTMPRCQWCIMMMKSSHAASRKLKRNYGSRIFIVHGTDGAVKTLADLNAQVGMMS